MKIFGVGTDIVKVSRFKHSLKNKLFLTRIFNNKGLETSSYMDNFTGIYKNEIFIDNAHLSDNGNEIVADEIIKKINF